MDVRSLGVPDELLISGRACENAIRVERTPAGLQTVIPGCERRTLSKSTTPELKEIIRDIRSDEANVYRELRSICAMCSDYDPKSPVWHDFYAHTQAKFMYAVTTHTPSEMVISRANADHENMGLRTWKGDHVTQADVDIAKNYLAESEIKELNRLTVILLDIFEDQLDLGKISTMAQIEALLDAQLRSLSRQVLRGWRPGENRESQSPRIGAIPSLQRQTKSYSARRSRCGSCRLEGSSPSLPAKSEPLPKS